MDPITGGGLIAAGGNLLGGVLGAVGQGASNITQKEIANDNRLFQLEMSNTAYQRATKDMQAAGINPMLAYMQGGASTGAGSGASTGNEMEGLAQGVSNAAKSFGPETALLRKQMEAQDAQIQKTKAETNAINVGSARNAATAPIYDLGSDAVKGIKNWFEQKTAPVGGAKSFFDKLGDIIHGRPISNDD